MATGSIDSAKLAPSQTAAGIEQDRPQPAAKRVLGSVGVAMSECRQERILDGFFGDGLISQLADGGSEHGRSMAVDELVEQFDLPGPDSFHDFLVVQHGGWRFQSAQSHSANCPRAARAPFGEVYGFSLVSTDQPRWGKTALISTMGCCRWMFGGAAAMMTAQPSTIVNGIPGVRIAELILATSATGMSG